MLCYVMLCYVMLCYVMLCYVMLRYVMLCYVIIGWAKVQKSAKAEGEADNTYRDVDRLLVRILQKLKSLLIVL